MSIDQVNIPPYYDLIVQALFEIKDRLADQSANGVLVPTTHTIGTNWESITGNWMSCTIYNDGDADVYIRTEDRMHLGNPWDNNEAPLKKGESLILDLEARKVAAPTLWFICQSGTATIRLFKMI